MRYFEDSVTAGEWDDVEKYLSGFTKVDDNRYSMKIFFEIRKQKYLEALDKKDNAKAVEILVKELKVFSTFNEELFKEITMLLTLTNFRENEQLSKYGDTKSARGIMLGELKKLIEANPLFRDKLQFPTLKNSRLRTLINQSLNWQHQLCKNPRPNPDIKTLFIDHSCGHPNGSHVASPATNHLMGSAPKVGGFPPLGAHGPFQPTPAPLTTSLAGWMPNPSVSHPTVSAGPIGLGAPNSAVSMLKHPRTPPTNSLAMDYQTADSESVLKRPRPFGISDGVNNLPVNVLPVTYPGQSHSHAAYSTDDLPKNVSRVLSQGSAIKSMDFHPVQQTMLLVGTNVGDIAIWEVGSRDKLVSRSFKVWDLASCTANLQASLASEYTAAANRVVWSPDGGLLGVAYSKHIVHIYSYHGGNDLRNHLEVDAHAGNVNDLAFSLPNQQLCFVTCGEDKTIKVWDAVTGNKLHTFEGHDAPVYSVCPHQKENIQFIFSTAVDGKIKAWLYDNMGSRVDYDAPVDLARQWHIVLMELDCSLVVLVRRGNHSLLNGMKFDTMKNKFLVAGDEFQVKFWDMDSVDLLTTTHADGDCRINKEGTLLAVSTTENGIKILANAEGSRILHSMANRGLESSRAPLGSVAKGPIVGAFGTPSSSTGMSLSMADRSGPGASVTGMNGDNRSLPDVKPRIPDDAEKSKIWKLTEISERSHLRTLRLPDSLIQARVVKLIYTNSGSAILALAENALHKLWKWQKNERISWERYTISSANSNIPPQLWQPSSGVVMTNDTREGSKEDVVPCFALSKNDSYVMSASGGKISLFNMMTFKTMTTFMAPPPAATSLAFHPQDNNIIAIGMDDSSIQIYNVRVDEVKSKLKGHQKRVTGLAFSNVLNVLVSSGADSQLCVWSMDGWEKQASKQIQIPNGHSPNPLAHTRVQFHQDQTHVLVVHASQLAIYEAPKLESMKQWIPKESSGSVTDAVYSCDSQSIYAAFDDGSVSILTATTLQLKCRIGPNSYLPSNPSSRVYPATIAAHPSEPNQFAVGLTDGGVHVIEPPGPEGKWGMSPPPENGAGPSVSAAPGSDQQPR
ncbi:hypothetical protein Bca52824_041320 [Brassica carinata]|uniref:CTLH domain-containing protein n=1 Tax=Brassica carinata TaxID=52824 RepID=A0A8X7UZX1_BRACI|nr:hypothetical protein Bca52824_041320 [Brassica carinata]